ncbi:hypothetical protein [Acinetobacter sp. Marseille-Q1623]|uniref:hypothetical protein n=1 Tax=Acinetobacter sp. Marseille-Q1623 TaxID=2697501 RepID=UPI00157A9505|nr:hypothetical protein [Acinetobacter sp. Marseille-Q1623]
MNFKEIFEFKLKLDLELISVKAIQDWADAQILIDHNNQIALHICYLSNDHEVLNYISHLIMISEEKNQNELKSVVALQVLKEYFQNHLPKMLDDQLDFHIVKLRELASYIYELTDLNKVVSLDSYIVAYDDQITLAIEGNAGMTPQMAYNELYQYLKDWIEEHI